MHRIYFVRHGQSEWNATQRFQGRGNSNLSDLGRRQAERSGRLLAGLDIQALFSSPLDRARQTAEIVNRHLGLSLVVDERIKEWDCGDWSGHLREEVLMRWPEEWAARQADMFHYRGPSCENYPDMFDRARPFVAGLERHGAERIAVVSHGMIGKVMIAILLGLDERQTLAIYQANDVVFRVTAGERPEAHHYRAGEGPLPGLVTHAD
jgi:broad specificity phosphatase PhoE